MIIIDKLSLIISTWVFYMTTLSAQTNSTSEVLTHKNPVTLREITKNMVDLLIKITPEKPLTLQLSKPFQNDSNGRTLLQLACFYDYQEVAVMLLNCPDCLNYINVRDNNSESALDIACKKGYYYFAFLLMEKGAIVNKIAYEIIGRFLIQLEEEMEKLIGTVSGRQANFLLPKIRHDVTQQFVYLRNMRSDLLRVFKKAKKFI